jgi:hypothetical protein
MHVDHKLAELVRGRGRGFGDDVTLGGEVVRVDSEIVVRDASEVVVQDDSGALAGDQLLGAGAGCWVAGENECGVTETVTKDVGGFFNVIVIVGMRVML